MYIQDMTERFPEGIGGERGYEPEQLTPGSIEYWLDEWHGRCVDCGELTVEQAESLEEKGFPTEIHDGRWGHPGMIRID